MIGNKFVDSDGTLTKHRAFFTALYTSKNHTPADDKMLEVTRDTNSTITEVISTATNELKRNRRSRISNAKQKIEGAEARNQQSTIETRTMNILKGKSISN